MTHRPFAPEGTAARLPGDAAGCPPAARPFVLAATIVGSSMAFIDGTVVNIALPAIQRGLGAGIAELQWVVNGYLLPLGALMLVGGGLGDRLGRRRVFVAGVVLFTLASLACALAPTIGILIAARVVQGIGAALLVPQSLALIAANFPKDIRGAAIGTWAAASAITTSLGPPLGGLLIDTLSWRVAFWINLPLAAVALWLTLRHVPESRDETVRGGLDWPGAILATLGFGAITYGLIGLGGEGDARLVAGAALVLGLVLLVVFILVERRVANPIMPPTLFASPVFSAANVVTVLLYAALSGALFLLPFDLVVRRGLTAAEAGLTILPFGVIIGVMSRFMGSLADRHGPRPFMTLGPVLFALGAGWLALALPGYWAGVMVPALLLAVGMGVVVSPLTTAVMNAVPTERSGAASGINNAASRLAGVVAVAVIGLVAGLVYRAAAPAGATVFGELPPAGDQLRTAAEAAFVSGYGAAMGLTAAMALAAAIVAWLTIPVKKKTEGSAG